MFSAGVTVYETVLSAAFVAVSANVRSAVFRRLISSASTAFTTMSYTRASVVEGLKPIETFCCAVVNYPNITNLFLGANPDAQYFDTSAVKEPPVISTSVATS